MLSVGSMIGVGFFPYLVNHYPLLLVALSPLGRHLMLVVPIVDPVALVAVGVLRRGAFYLACFQLGRALGPAGVHWLEERAARFARALRWLEALFARAPRLVVLVMAGPTISMLAGMARMETATYIPLALVSLVVRLLVIVWFGEILREPIEWVLAWLDENWVSTTAVLVVATLGVQWWRIRRARRQAPEFV